MMRLGLGQFFADHPHCQMVGYAVDGYDAVETAIELRPDLIIMDIGLPQQDGIAATQQIKAKLPNVRVVILTSHNDETEMIAALSSGADACCIKGARLEQLSVAISAAQQGATRLAKSCTREVSKEQNRLMKIKINNC